MAVNPICMHNEGVTHYLIPCINYLKILCHMGGEGCGGRVIALAKEEHYNSTMPQSDLCHLLHNLTDLKYQCSNGVLLMNECFVYLRSNFPR